MFDHPGYQFGGPSDPYRPTYGYEGTEGMLQLGLQTLGPMFGQHIGATPFGLTQNNPYDQLNRMRMTQMHDEFMQHASRANQTNYEMQLRGLAATIGLPWGPDQQAASRQLSQTLRSAEPMLAQSMPYLLDQLSGLRGSPTVMAEYLFRGGMFRDDPVTGSRGMRQASLEQLNDTLYARMFAGQNYLDMGGMTAGQTGILFNTLQQRGRMSAAMRMNELPENLLRDAARRQGVALPDDLTNMTAEQMSSLGNDARVGQALRGGDAGRVERTLRQYTETLSAIRDIFGDNGRPNAPIPELLNALDGLSGGLSQQVSDPTRLANQIRTTANLARTSGVGMPELSQLTAATQQSALQMGLGTTAAPEAVRNALAFRNAYQSLGFGANRGWDVADLDFQQQQVARLTLAATRSPAANMIGMAARIESEMGNVFGADTNAGRYLAAVRGGIGTFAMDGRTTSTNMSEADFINMLVASSGGRLSAGQLGSMLEQRAVNREYGEQIGAATYVQRTLQGQQLRSIVSAAVGVPFGGQIDARMNALGISLGDDARGALLASTRDAAAESLFSMSDETRKDARARNAAMVEAMRKSLAASPGGRQLLDGPGGEEFLTGMAMQAFGAADVQVRGRTNMSLLTAMSMNDPRLLARAAQEQQSASIEGRIQQQLSGLGRGSVLQRLTQGLMDADINDPKSVENILGRALNFQPNDAVHGKLNAAAVDLQQRRAALDGARTAYMNEKDPARRAALLQQYNAAATALEQSIRAVGEAGEAAGMTRDPSLTQAGVARALRESNFLDQQLAGKDVEAIAAGANAEQQSARNISGGLTSDESLRRLGSAAVTRAAQLDRINDRLGELASQHTGGDLGKLLSGKFDGAGAVMDEVRRLRGERREAMEWAYSNAERGGKVDDAEFEAAKGERDRFRGQERERINAAVRSLLGQDGIPEQTIVERVGGQEFYNRIADTDGGANRLQHISKVVQEYRRIRDTHGGAAADKFRDSQTGIPSEFFNLDESDSLQGAEDPRKRGLQQLLREGGIAGEATASTSEFKFDIANLHISRDGTATMTGKGTGTATRGTA